MPKRKLICIFLSLVMCASLFACSPVSTPSPDSGQNFEPSGRVTIGSETYTDEDSFIDFQTPLSQEEVNSLRELSASKNLKSITICFDESVKDFSALASISGLEKLAVRVFCADCGKAVCTPAELCGLNALEVPIELIIEGDFTQADLDGIAALSKVSNITAVTLQCADTISSIDAISSLAGLEVLRIAGFSGSLKPISRLAALRDLSIAKCGDVNIAELAGSGIKNLAVTCKDVDFTLISEISGIEQLSYQHSMARTTGPEDAVYNFSYGESFDLTPFIEHPTLVQLVAVFSPSALGLDAPFERFTLTAADIDDASLPEWLPYSLQQLKDFLAKDGASITILCDTD